MSDTETTKTVTASNGDTYEIEAFSTRRSGQMVDEVGALIEAYGSVLEDANRYRREYAEQNPQTITRDQVAERVAVLRTRAATVEDADQASALEAGALNWERLLEGDLAEKASVTLPGVAPEEQVWASVLRPAIQTYSDEVARVIGLIVMTNEEFAAARKTARRSSDGSDRLEDALLDAGDEVLDKVGIDDTIHLLIAGGELLLGDMKARKDLVGKLQAVVQNVLGATTETDDPEETSDSTSESDTSSESSTSSQDATDGPKTTSSTDSPSVEPATSLT